MKIYKDRSRRASMVVENELGLWLIPRAAAGWTRRVPLTLTAAARSERLRPAADIDPGWLGIPPADVPQTCARNCE